MAAPRPRENMLARVRRWATIKSWYISGLLKRAYRASLAFYRETALLIRSASLPFIAISYTALMSPLAFNLFQRAQITSSSDPAALRDALLSLGAIIGAPFVAWRTWIAWKQAEAAQESHFTDLYTKAVEQLGAERDAVDHAGTPIKRPNTELRVGAILALERIAHDSLKDYWRVMEVLATYIRNNSPAPVKFEATASNPVLAIAMSEWATAVDKHLEKLPAPPADIQVAIDVLARRGRKGIAYERRNRLRLDLSGVNLQRVRFSRWYDDETGATHSNFAYVDFSDAYLDGCELISVDFSYCVFSDTSMIGATLLGANLHSSRFYDAVFNSATFSGAKMRGTDIQACQGRLADFNDVYFENGGILSSDLSGADFSGSEIRKSSFIGNQIPGGDLTGTDFKGSSFSLNVLTGAKLYRANLAELDYRYSENSFDLEGAKGDVTTRLPKGRRPLSWPDCELSWEERRNS